MYDGILLERHGSKFMSALLAYAELQWSGGALPNKRAAAWPPGRTLQLTPQAVTCNLMEAPCAGCSTQLAMPAEGMPASHHLKLLLQNALPAALVHLLLVNLEGVLQAQGTCGA